MSQRSRSRRQILIELGTIAVAVTLDQTFQPRVYKRLAYNASSNGPVRFLSWHDSAMRIGVEYLRTCREERSIPVLFHLICPDQYHPETEYDGKIPLANLRNRLEPKIRADFELEEIVCLRGWILSRTEARFCALVALS